MLVTGQSSRSTTAATDDGDSRYHKCGTPALLEFQRNYRNLDPSLLAAYGSVAAADRPITQFSYDSPGGRIKIHYDKTGSGAVWQANVDSDGDAEIACTLRTKKIYLLHHDGRIADGFPVQLRAFAASSPVLYDIDGDGRLEIIVALTNGEVDVLRGDGTQLVVLRRAWWRIAPRLPRLWRDAGDLVPGWRSTDRDHDRG